MFCTSASTYRPCVGAALIALFTGCAALPQKPLPPQVALDAVRVTRLTAADTRFTLTLAVQNPNAYDLAVNALDCDLSLEGEPVITGSLKAPTVLAASAATRVEIEARTTLRRRRRRARSHARRCNTVHYEVKGAAVVQDGLRLPFARSGELPAGDLLGGKR